MKSNPKKILIIGAGPSGLVAAQRLVALGVTDITVLEAAAEVGGKCCSVTIEDRIHDMGATMGVPIDYQQITNISDEAGIERTPFPREQCFDLETGNPERLNSRWEIPKLLAQLVKYLRLQRRCWAGTDGSGLHRASSALRHSWQDMARQTGLELLSKRTLSYRTGYGYGYDDTVPAVLHANLIRPSTILGLMRGKSFMWRGGTQGIWKSLANTLAAQGVTITTNARVQEIVSVAAGVEVRVEGEDLIRRFDTVIAALDPRITAALLRDGVREQQVFSQAVSMPYATFACKVTGMNVEGKASVGYLRQNMQRGREGHIMAWVKRYPDSDIYVCHLFAPESMEDSDIAGCIAEDVHSFGGTLKGVLASRRWSFFPHFPVAATRAGAYEQAEALQGSRQVYYTGEFFSYATMARAAEHGRQTAERVVREFKQNVADDRQTSLQDDCWEVTI